MTTGHLPFVVRRFLAALTPESAVLRPGTAGGGHPDGPRRLHGAAGRPAPALVEAGERTLAWAERARAGRIPGPGQLLCSGSRRAASEMDLRAVRRATGRRSASTATPSAACPWASQPQTGAAALAAVCRHLPAEQPRYLMGVGDPVSLVQAIGARGRHVRLRVAHAPWPARLGAHQRRAPCI